jgi:hypothetical protein
MTVTDRRQPLPGGGETLRQRLDRERPSVHDAVEIAARLVLAPGTLPGSRVRARTIRPETIWLTGDGGAAIVRSGEPAQDDVAYASPEQTRGEAGDERSDVWTIGVLMYEMLAGRTPFVGSSTDALVHSIHHDWAAPLNEVNAEVGPELVAVIDRCLEKDPARRFASPLVLVQALRDVERTGPDRVPVAGVTIRRALRLNAVVPRPAIIVPMVLAVALLLLVVGLALMRSVPRVVEARGGAGDAFAAQRALLLTAVEAPGRPDLAAAVGAALPAALRDADVELVGPTLNGPLDLDVALDAGRRLGAGAVLHVSLTRTGRNFVLVGRGLRPEDGSELFVVRAAAREHRLMDAVELFSREVRRRLGEPRR